MWSQSVSFSSVQRPVCYLVDEGGIRTTTDFFTDLSHLDFVRETFPQNCDLTNYQKLFGGGTHFRNGADGAKIWSFRGVGGGRLQVQWKAPGNIT